MPIVLRLASYAARRRSFVFTRAFLLIDISSFAVIHRDEEDERHEQKRFHVVFLEARIATKVIIVKKCRRGQTRQPSKIACRTRVGIQGIAGSQPPRLKRK